MSTRGILLALVALSTCAPGRALVAQGAQQRQQHQRGGAGEGTLDPSPEEVLAQADHLLTDSTKTGQEAMDLAHGKPPPAAPGVGLLEGARHFLARLGLAERRVEKVVPKDVVALVRRTRLAGGQEPQVQEETATQTIIGAIIQSLVYGILVSLVAVFCYTTQPEVDVEAGKSMFAGKPFTHHPFSCFDDMTVCAWSCCCAPIKWADNMQAVQFYGFWAALVIFLIMQCTADVLLVTWIFSAAFFAYNRQRLRTLFGMKNESGDMVTDYCMWCWCGCCAVAQESRHLAELKKDSEKA